MLCESYQHRTYLVILQWLTAHTRTLHVYTRLVYRYQPINMIGGSQPTRPPGISGLPTIGYWAAAGGGRVEGAMYSVVYDM